MSKLRIAIIGAGHLGRIHTRLLRSIEDVDVVGVADPVAAARKSITEEFDLPVIDDFRDWLGQIDAAIVAAPTCHHHAIGMQLLERGVHTFMEKPLATSVADAHDLVRTANERDLVLQVGHVEQFNPALLAVRANLVNPKYIDATRTSGYTFRSTDIGAVLDIMIHDLDVILSLVNSELVEVQALGVSVFGGHEDMAQARLQFASGCVANLIASRCSFQQQRKMQVFTPQGFASIDFAAPSATTIIPADELRQRHGDFDNLGVGDKERVKRNLFNEYLPVTTCDVQPTNAILDEQHDFIASIRQHRAPRVSGQQGLNAIAAAERILTCIAEHRWNGDAAGPVGAHLESRPPILKGPHWAGAPSRIKNRRKAG